MIEGLDFDEASHIYRVKGRIVPSVTQLLAPLSGIEAVPADILERAGRMGHAVHKACELFDLEDLDERDLDPNLDGYLTAWKAFCKDYDTKWDAIEERVFSPQFGYAGTLDRAGRVGGIASIVDLKTSFKLYATVGPQLAAYQKAYGRPTAGRWGVQLKPDGSYIAKRYVSPSDWAVFASMTTIYRFAAENGITPNWKVRNDD